MLTLIGTLVLLVVVAGGIVLISVVIAKWGHEDVPQERPPWMGPDPAAIEAALRSVLDPAGRLEEAPDVAELARVHAHDMALRHFSGEVDPEGQGLAPRRERLHPKMLGVARQWQTLLLADETKYAAGIAGELWTVDPDHDALARDEAWTDLGVGVAIEEGRCGACAVWLAREEDPEKDP